MRSGMRRYAGIDDNILDKVDVSHGGGYPLGKRGVRDPEGWRRKIHTSM